MIADMQLELIVNDGVSLMCKILQIEHWDGPRVPKGLGSLLRRVCKDANELPYDVFSMKCTGPVAVLNI